jgi:small subunit ribosomal protein S9
MEVIQKVGKRKRAIAIVRLKEGEGEIIVNNKSVKEYFGRDDLIKYLKMPFEVIESKSKFNVKAVVKGGGISGQAGAIRLGIAKCLVEINPEWKHFLKERKMLTRDPREKERRKYGRAKARKSFQWTKR